MKFDVVEREFYILGSDLARLSKSFQALAMALRQERESDRMHLSRRDAPDGESKNQPGPPESGALPF